ncbi:diguanylate cyclase [Xanthobacteraceae bacterium A53D]
MRTPVPQTDSREATPHVRVPRTAHLVIVLALILSVTFVNLIALNIWQGRRDIWAQAVRTANNLSLILSRDIQRRFEVDTALLHSVATTLQDPSFARSDESTDRLLRRTMAGQTGHMMLLDAKGQMIADAGAEPLLQPGSDRHDYFYRHQENPRLGLYVSEPIVSRRERGLPSMIFSVRLNDAAGAFAGVIAMSVNLQSIDDLFQALDTRPGDSVALIRKDGFVVLRQPGRAEAGTTPLNVSGSPNFRRFMDHPSGHFVGAAQIDGEERLYSFQHVVELPLIVAIGLSVDQILDGWLHRSIVTGIVTLLLCVAMLAASLALRREIIRRAELQMRLAQLSITDTLTGLANRRLFDETLTREWGRSARRGSPLSLLMIDVDRFKLLNDRFGHARGDDVLRTIARTLDGRLRRSNDTAARYGGEEFVAILPETDLEGATALAQQILQAIQEEASRPEMIVTVSIGVSTLIPDEEGQETRLIEAAELALFRAKEQGRNKVVGSRPPPAGSAMLPGPTTDAPSSAAF